MADGGHRQAADPFAEAMALTIIIMLSIGVLLGALGFYQEPPEAA